MYRFLAAFVFELSLALSILQCVQKIQRIQRTLSIIHELCYLKVLSQLFLRLRVTSLT